MFLSATSDPKGHGFPWPCSAPSTIVPPTLKWKKEIYFLFTARKYSSQLSLSLPWERAVDAESGLRLGLCVGVQGLS